MFFAAVEVRKDEPAHEAVKAFVVAASKQGVLFSKLKVYGFVDVGSTRFVRFCSDCGNYTTPFLEQIRSEGRGVIVPSKAGTYIVRMADGRTGPFNASQMQAIIAPGFGQVYKGTKVEFWERQFS